MTVTNTTQRIKYDCSGITGPFTFPFSVASEEDLKVVINDGSTDTVLTLTTDYTVSLTADGFGGYTGSITTVTAYSADYDLTIICDIDPTQETGYTDGDSFPAAAHEANVDKLTRLHKQVEEVLGRVPYTDPGGGITGSVLRLSPSPSRVIGWDASGQALTTFATTSVNGAATFDTVSNYADLAAAVAAIGAGIQTLFIDEAAAVDADLTIPANIAIAVFPGCLITVANTKTLTINGDIDAGAYQIFSGDGTVTIGSQVIGGVYPEWWGIDGTADDVQINAAINSFATNSGTVKLVRRGRANGYSITATIICRDGLKLEGASFSVGNNADDEGTWLIPTAAVTDYVVDINELDGWGLENISIDMALAGSSAVGVASRGSWTGEKRNLFVDNIEGSQVGFLVEGDTRGPYWNVFHGCTARGNSAVKTGTGFKLVGVSGKTANKISLYDCRAYHCAYGLYGDWCGSGVVLHNFQSEENGTDGVCFVNGSYTNGPPLLIGGEIDNNTGYGINGACTLINTSVNNNGTNVSDDVCRFRHYQSGAVNGNFFTMSQLLSTTGLIQASDEQTIDAVSDTISSDKTLVYLGTDAGSYTLTSTPSIAAGEDGQLLILAGKSSGESVVIQDDTVLGSSGVRLRNGDTCTIGYQDTIVLVYDTGNTKWRELFRSTAPGDAYTPTNVTPDRAYDANSTTTDELADVLGTLITDLQAAGIIK